MTSTSETETGVEAVRAELVLFGFPPSPGTARVRPRSRAWRLAGAARTMAVFLVVAPVAAILPPHAPWALGALGVGGLLARRRWTELFTLESFAAPCPKCGENLELGPVRLQLPHPVQCESCNFQSALRLPADFLDGAAT